MYRGIFVALCTAWLVALAVLAVQASSYPTPINTRITFIPQLNNEEQVFICPTDSNIVIANWRDFRLGYRQIGVGRSTNGGVTWTDSLISVDMQLFGDNAYQSDPTMTVDRYGNFYMSVLDYDADGDGSAISFYKSTDQGISWTGPVPHIAELGDREIFEDKQFITVDRTGGPYDGNVYCSWARFPDPVRILFVRSTDGCMSFEDTVLIGPVQTSSGCGTYEIGAGQFSIPIVSSDGNVHVFWVGFALDSGSVCSGTEVIKHVESSDGGQTFGGEDTLLSVSGYTYARGGIQTYSQPVGDADITGGPFDGNIYLAFTNLGPEDGSCTDVDFVRSTDGGATWSDRYQINDALDSENIDAFHPWLVCNQEGILCVIFYDQRYDPDDYFSFDLLAAYSFDGGETFTTNHRISDASSSPADLASTVVADADPVFGGGQTAVYSSTMMAGVLGEYVGVTTFYDKILAVWTDTRDGNSEVYSATWNLPLLEPRLIAPVNYSTLESQPTLRWATGWKHDQDEYIVEISPSEDFSGTVHTSVVDTNFLAYPGVPEYETYYWRVKTRDLNTGALSDYSPTWQYAAPGALCGDVDVNGTANITDIYYFIEWLMRGGPPLLSEAAGDVDHSGEINIEDIVYFIDYLLRGGPELDCW